MQVGPGNARLALSLVGYQEEIEVCPDLSMKFRKPLTHHLLFFFLFPFHKSSTILNGAAGT
jgi:hypothetical protein